MSLHGKRGKRSSLAPSSGLIALGSSNKRDSIEESRKRDISSAFSSVDSSSAATRESKYSKLSDSDAVDLASQLVSFVNNTNSLVPKLIESLKLVAFSRVNPPESLFTSILYVFKENDGKDLLETYQNLMRAVTDILKEPANSSAKQRPSNAAVLLACNIFLHSFRKCEVWPLALLRLFIDDYLGERIWTEGAASGSSNEFVNNLTFSFTTTLPPNFSDSTGAQKPKLFIGASGGPAAAVSSFKEETRSPIGSPGPSNVNTDYKNRYYGLHVEIGRMITEVGNDVMSKKPLPDVTLRSLLHLLAISCGVPQVRLFASSKLDLWLHNTKLLKPAQDLFAAVCLNVFGDGSGVDSDVISNLVRLKPKTKIVSGIVSHGLKEMLQAQPEISETLVKNIVFNEFSGTNRNPNNMNLLTHLFQNNLEETSKHLASAFQLVLYQKEDFSKAVKTFFREIIKAQRHELRIKTFCMSLLKIKDEVSGLFDNEKLPVGKYYSYIIDVATYSLLISIPPNCREIYTSRLKREERDHSPLIRMQTLVSEIIYEFVHWLKDNAVHFNQEQFCSVLQRVIFSDPCEAYFRGDSWPQDQSICYRVITESVTLESTISNLIVLGLEPSFLVTAPDVMQFIETLVTRSPSRSVTITNEKELFTGLFNLAVYTKPASIVLPASYKQPQLAVASLLWKAWTILTVLAGSNTETVAKLGWMHYPSLKMFMEMALTSDFTFPPSTSQLNTETLRIYEIQTKEQEKQEIINFECHLAGKTITAENSILAAQLVFIDPMNLPRQTQNEFLAHLKNICTSLKIGTSLCSSRDTDYLLDILQRNQSLSGMAWLSQIILTSNIQTLPPQCLCEYLLSEMTRDSASLDRCDKMDSIKCYLRSLIASSDVTSDHVLQVLRYFFTAMCSCENFCKRKAASSALICLLSENEPIQSDIIFQTVSQLKCSEVFSTELTSFALQTFSFEFDLPLLVSAFCHVITTLNIQSGAMTNIILFCETFVRRSDVITSIIMNYSQVKSIIPQFVSKVWNHFLSSSKQPANCENWVEINVEKKTLVAPKDVVIALFGLFVLTEDDLSNHCHILKLPFSTLNTILPDWIKQTAVMNSANVISSWIQNASEASEVVDFCFIFGTSSIVNDLIKSKMESFTLNHIKSSLKSHKSSQFIIASNFGAKFECAYNTVMPDSTKRKTVAFSEIDEMDVDIGTEKQKPSIDVNTCKTVNQFVTFISESMNISQNDFCDKIIAICDDHTLLAEAIVEIISRKYSIFDIWACEYPGEFKTFTMNITHNLRFNFLNRWYTELMPLLENTKHGNVLKFMKRFIDDEEVRMQPESPEPEVKISLRAKTLLDAGKCKEGPVTGRKMSLTGKTLDMLKTSDPETIKQHVNYLWKVIFSAEHDSSAYHCYLLSLLVHSSNWDTLNDCVSRILEGMTDDENMNLNSTTILDFLAALLSQPRLFQGRDSALLRKSHSAVMTLKVSDLCKLIDIIADEGGSFEESHDDDASHTVIDSLQPRVVLLLKFTDKRSLETIQSLLDYSSTCVKSEKVSKSLVMLIYLNTAVPLSEDHKTRIEAVSTKADNSFEEDCLMHNIFLPISLPTCSKDSMQLASCVVLKFASMHPIFMNRQIELISVLLQGRSRSSWTAFRKEGNADLFRLCLRVLTRLTPRVFEHPQFPPVMNCILEAYGVFASLTNELFRESRTLLFSVIDSMFEYNCELTSRILQPHATFIYNYPAVNKHLLNSLKLLDADSDPGNVQSACQIVNHQSAVNDILRCRKFIVGFTNIDYCTDEVMNTLKIIEDLSHKRVKQLSIIVEPLGSLLLSKSSELVEKCISCLLSICRHIPSASDDVSSAFIKALRTRSNPNTHKLLNMVNLDSLVSCCSDNGVNLVTTIFDAAISQGIPLDEQLKKLISGQTLENILRQDNF